MIWHCTTGNLCCDECFLFVIGVWLLSLWTCLDCQRSGPVTQWPKRKWKENRWWEKPMMWEGYVLYSLCCDWLQTLVTESYIHRLIINNHVTHTDTQSYAQHSVDAVCTSAEQEEEAFTSSGDTLWILLSDQLVLFVDEVMACRAGSFVKKVGWKSNHQMNQNIWWAWGDGSRPNRHLQFAYFEKEMEWIWHRPWSLSGCDDALIINYRLIWYWLVINNQFLIYFSLVLLSFLVFLTYYNIVDNKMYK